MEQDSKLIGIMALVAVALQLIIAPNIQIMGVMPDFLVSFVLVVCLIRPLQNHYVLAFVMGMLSDLMGSGVVGTMALCLLLSSFFMRFVAEAIGSDNPVSAFAILAGFSLLVLLAYSFFLSGAGLLQLPAGLVFYTLPCAVYDALLSIIWFVVGNKILGAHNSGPTISTMPNLRF